MPQRNWCNGADGTFGLGFDSDTVSGFPGPVTPIAHSLGVPNVFGLYVGSRAGAPDGALTIGGVDRRLFTGRIHYVPTIWQGKYAVAIHALTIGDYPVVSGVEQFGHCQIDSGTTLSYIPEAAYRRSAVQRSGLFGHSPGDVAVRARRDCLGSEKVGGPVTTMSTHWTMGDAAV